MQSFNIVFPLKKNFITSDKSISRMRQNSLINLLIPLFSFNRYVETPVISMILIHIFTYSYHSTFNTNEKQTIDFVYFMLFIRFIKGIISCMSWFSNSTHLSHEKNITCYCCSLHCIIQTIFFEKENELFYFICRYYVDFCD